MSWQRPADDELRWKTHGPMRGTASELVAGVSLVLWQFARVGATLSSSCPAASSICVDEAQKFRREN